MDWSVVGIAVAVSVGAASLGLLVGVCCYRRGAQAGACRMRDEFERKAARRPSRRRAPKSSTPEEALEQQETTHYQVPPTARARQTGVEEVAGEITDDPTRPAIDQELLARCRAEFDKRRNPRVARAPDKTDIGQLIADLRNMAPTAEAREVERTATPSVPSLSPFAKRAGSQR